MTQFPQLSATRREFLQRATDAYYQALSGSPAVAYLTDRGLTGRIAQDQRLGYVAEPAEGHERFTGRLSIPYITPSGVSAIRFRRIGDDGPKYDQESGSYTPLFNVRDLHRREPHVAICEGEMDTLVMSGICDVPAVGIGGVDQWNANGKIYRRLFEDYERVFVVMDPDDPGQKVAKAIIKAVPNPLNVVLPADVNDTYLDEGADFIREQMGLQ